MMILSYLLALTFIQKPTFAATALHMPRVENCEGVFPFYEAQNSVLPYFKKKPALFQGKRVLEIGVGTGIVSAFFKANGAKAVVGTDIEPKALVCSRSNLEKIKGSGEISLRQVTQENSGAFAVIQKDEKFDLIFSNPPYVFDLGQTKSSALSEDGSLLISLASGLKNHLAADGVAVFFYGSRFGHELAVEVFRKSGYVVESHPPTKLLPMEYKLMAEHFSKSFFEKHKLGELPLSAETPEQVAMNCMRDPPRYKNPQEGFIEIRLKR